MHFGLSLLPYDCKEIPINVEQLRKFGIEYFEISDGQECFFSLSDNTIYSVSTKKECLWYNDNEFDGYLTYLKQYEKENKKLIFYPIDDINLLEKRILHIKTMFPNLRIAMKNSIKNIDLLAMLIRKYNLKMVADLGYAVDFNHDLCKFYDIIDSYYISQGNHKGENRCLNQRGYDQRFDFYDNFTYIFEYPYKNVNEIISDLILLKRKLLKNCN